MKLAETAKRLVQRVTGEVPPQYPPALRSQGFSREEDLATVAREPELKRSVRAALDECERIRAAVKAGDMNGPKLDQARRAVDIASAALRAVEYARERLWNYPAPSILQERGRIRVELTELRGVQRDRRQSIEDLEKEAAAAEVRLKILRSNGERGPYPEREIEEGKQAIAAVQDRLEDLRRIAGEYAAKMHSLEKRRDELKRMAWGLPASVDVD